MLSASRFIHQSRKLYDCGGMLQHNRSVSARKAPSSYIPSHGMAVPASFRKFLARFSTALPFQCNKSRGKVLAMMTSVQSCFSGSHLSKLQNNFVSVEELFHIIKSACYKPEGQSHHWLNNACKVNRLLSHGGITLVLVNAYIRDDSLVDQHDRILMIEGVKLIQKTYAKLNVIGLQCVSSANSVEIHSKVLKTIMEEYISFPVLLLDRNLIKVVDSAVYLFFEGATSQPFYIKTEAELGSIKKGSCSTLLLSYSK